MIRTKTGIRFLAVLLAISIWITAAPFCVPTSISFDGLPFRAAAEEAEEAAQPESEEAFDFEPIQFDDPDQTKAEEAEA